MFLVGGFAASDWLFSQLQQGLLSRDDVECYRPDSHVCVLSHRESLLVVDDAHSATRQ